MRPHPQKILTSLEDAATDNLPLTSGFKYYPLRRDDQPKNPELWLKAKAVVDGAHPYWRIHDKLYDMTSFIKNHPGGKFWIETTQGTDITELFECSHFGSGPRKILEKYYIKNASAPRNSPFTFEENGFYKTLQRKVTPILQKAGRGPTRTIKLIHDSMLFGFLFFFFCTAWFDSVVCAVLSGIFVMMTANVSHNFCHQKDNWRMHVYDLTIPSSRDWRIAHVLSHHSFPNTIYDFDIAYCEPFMLLFSRKNKSFLYRKSIPFVTIFLCLFGFCGYITQRVTLLLIRKIKPRLEYVLLPIQIAVLVMATGSIYRGLWLSYVLHTSSTTLLVLLNLTSSHHHVDIYHEGDAPYADKDWGLLQLAATGERKEIMSSLFLVVIAFGNHTLHHLFPTVDHSKLHLLMPAFLETCAEFGIKFEMYSCWELFKGSFALMINTIPNPNISKCFKGC